MHYYEVGTEVYYMPSYKLKSSKIVSIKITKDTIMYQLEDDGFIFHNLVGLTEKEVVINKLRQMKEVQETVRSRHAEDITNFEILYADYLIGDNQ